MGVPSAAAEDGIAGHSQVVETTLVGAAAPAAAMVAGIVVVEDVGRIVAVVVSVVLVECAGEMVV